MGRICPILNHPLKDGVLIDDDEVVAFINKRNVDFLPTELVCRTCKNEIIKLFNLKRNRARKMQKDRCKDGSVSSLKSKTSSSTSSIYDGSQQIAQIEQDVQGREATVLGSVGIGHIGNNSKGSNQPTARVISVSQTSIVLSSSLSNAHSILQENVENQIANKSPAEIQPKSATLRKRIIKDFFSAKPGTAIMTPITPPSTIAAQSSKNVREIEHITASNSSEVDNDARRLSQEPTTSAAARATKTLRRRIILIDSDDEDDLRLSINALNGARLPHIQPVPPKRKPQQEKQQSLARDIMDEYIKDITGG